MKIEYWIFNCLLKLVDCFISSYSKTSIDELKIAKWAINRIDFNSKINFRFLRICPKDFQGWPGLRADVSAREITPNQIEAQWMVPFSNAEELKQIKILDEATILKILPYIEF